MFTKYLLRMSLMAAAAAMLPVAAPAQTRQQCLDFLYSYLPLPDSVDQSTQFMEENVDYALRARSEMAWGKKVPLREFMHFVLPMRVNNEWLDGCRPVFYEELRPRLQGLSMQEAILEVNHWCHEKATYQPSDGRTHSPLMTVYTHLGRCGEESTFTVAALRAVGIPARQVYTPRWAHTDDNHAWVEAWADGRWHFLGACEPEPVLDLGWFNSAAARGMLMNTRVMGRYDGPEEVLLATDQYVDINVTSNYAPVGTVRANVVHADGSPAGNATVSFRLYNYGEFYPIATKRADSHGQATLSCGLGDLLVWASDPATGQFGLHKANAATADSVVTITLGELPAQGFDIDIIPPAPGGSTPEVTAAQAAENDRRKAREDSIRTAVPFHHDVITRFLASVAPEDSARARALVASLSDKDRTDVSEQVLRDHLTAPVVDSPLYADYVLCPRVAREELTPYRQYLRSVLPMERYAADPQGWVKWVADSIRIIPDWYPSSLTLSPRAVWQNRYANAASRAIFFVASARAMGIPARIDPVTGKSQWADASSRWHDTGFEATLGETPRQGSLQLTYQPVGRIDNPKYYVHFSLTQILPDGSTRLMEYPDEATLTDLFSRPATLDAGRYMLVSGQRMASGAVLAHVEFLTVSPDSLTTAQLTIRQDGQGVQVIGAFNAENLYLPQGSSTPTSLLSTAGRGFYVVGLINPNHEPSAHVLNDLIAEAPALEQWGRSIIMLFDSEDALSRFDSKRFPGLPSTLSFGSDIDGTIARSLTQELRLAPTDRPIIAVVDSFNRVVYVVQGYTIGLGNQLLDIIQKLPQ
jgi:transglutaminase-like putative cysteine protease